MLIASWNVNSIAVRLPHVLNYLKESKVDHLGLQELKTTDDKFPYTEFSEAGYSCLIKGEKTYNGVALVSQKETPCRLVADVLPGAPEPLQSRLIDVLLPQSKLRILNLYVPNGSQVDSDKYEYKLKWFDALLTYVGKAQESGEHLLIMGDFNIAPEDKDVHDPAQWEGQVLVSERERQCFQRLLSLGFTDSFRHLHEEGGVFSWWDYRQMAFRRNMGLRIDHILLSQSLLPFLKQAWVDKSPRKLEKPSDHAPVLVELDL